MARPLSTAQMRARCKCCGAMAKIFCVLDLHQNVQPNKQDLCGIPIYYHRCDACGFIFCLAFDHFTNADFAHWIYTEDYGLVDLGYNGSRAQDNATLLSTSFPDTRDVRILDYGGGSGHLAKRLREKGFKNVDTYDPFVAEHAKRPAHQYDLVLSFEVVEHTCKPAESLEDIVQFLDPRGLLIFSTQLQPKDVKEKRAGWWYINPRAGHVAIHSDASLAMLLGPMGLHHRSVTDLYHIAWRGEVPSFANHLIRKP